MTLRVPKTSQTYADALLALGLARLVDRWLSQVQGWRDLFVVDAGAYYEIRVVDRREQIFPLPDPMQARYFASIARYIKSKHFAELPEERFPSRDVDKVWERVRTYANSRSSLSKKGVKGTEAEQQQLKDNEPPPEWQIVAWLGTRQMQALPTYNKIVAAWARLEQHFPQYLQAFLSLATQAEDAESVYKEWRRLAKEDGVPNTVTASQLLNPHQGKGQNQPKIASLQPSNMSNPWPIEYLKAAGLWEITFPRQTSDTKDWKVYVLAPRRIWIRDLRRVYARFARTLWRERRQDTTSLKTDITSILLFYQTWLDYSLEHANDPNVPTNPTTVVHGFYTVQFKMMSRNAYTMLNQSFLHLPEWGKDIKTQEDVQSWKHLLQEHLNVVHSIDERHSGGYDLLKEYRDFVAGGKWEAFFNFTRGYAHYLMQRLAQNQYAVQFTTNNLRRLLMTGPKRFSQILETPGFQEIAYAIRHSTVIPQFWKAQYKRQKTNEPPLYEVRYGLAAELQRKATVAEEFITALMNFLQSYNQENAQKLESTGKQRRKDVRTTAIDEIVHLIDEYGSEVVANLLIAYGYAREPRENVEETGEAPVLEENVEEHAE
ncbi:hypothetical protein ARMA_0098 [Ardenticatena maritima]|uniref:Type I-B CRISPR-associated protein Cas8b1/Cst1 n=1 Tax=Ardenticatena maritima TaxID=872965 RepID=A0A0M8K4X8_9CHLR|nr:hypothetical protein [Ardenticatena maritima]KPL87621.1 hypothetical protein SE16_08320 [Ardenticatena maritima]GAP61675.1 hypothetical protein ARMA_0098 [Ardenticatena maritima]